MASRKASAGTSSGFSTVSTKPAPMRKREPLKSTTNSAPTSTATRAAVPTASPGSTRPKHWTYSRLSDFETCPRLYAGRHLKYFGEHKEVKSDALIRGDGIHQLMEQAMRKGTPLPGALSRYNALLGELREAWPFIECEDKLGFDAEWRPVDWSAPGMWLRAKMDFFGYSHKTKPKTAKVIDYKTGRMYGENRGQVILYAGMAFERFSSLPEVNVELIYLDQRTGVQETITRKEWNGHYKPDFTARAGAMLSARRFEPNPGTHCDRCPFGPSKKGPCPGRGDDRGGLQTTSRVLRVVASEVTPLRRARPRQDIGDAGQAGGADRVQTAGAGGKGVTRARKPPRAVDSTRF